MKLKPGTSLAVPGKRYFFFGVALIAVFALAYVFATRDEQGKQNLKTEYYSTEIFLSPSEPTQITIPKIGLNAAIVELDLKSDKTLEVPKEGSEVGWFKYSPTPGEKGPAILVGHLDWYRGARGAFFELDQLRPGDRVKVRRADGTSGIFEVREVEVYSQDEFDTQKVYGPVNHASLRLITCTGDFLKQEDRYSHNLVVFADLVGYE